MTPEFTHLHVASSYSLRYGTATPAALAARAASLGMPAIALTDRDGLYGAFKHIQACADAGIRALLGADLALLPSGAAVSRHGGLPPISPGPRGSHQPGRVTLLAAGRRGWASLCRLVSAAHAASAQDATSATRAADEDVPAVTAELIAEHAAGLVVLLGPASDVGQAVAARRPDLARHALGRWRHLGVDTAVEIVDHLGHKSTFRAARLAELARDTRTPAVLTNAVRYLDPVDSLTAQVLDAARHLVPLGSPRLVPHNGRAYLASQEDMAATTRRVAAAMSGPGTASAATVLLGETEELARRCVLDPVLDLGVGTHHLPETQGPEAQRPGIQSTAYDQYKELRMRCERAILQGRYRTAGAASRPRGVSRLRAAQTARERLDHELDIIARTGMAGYFLTVADVTDRIRQAGIRCAIRGSGAGSFVNHLLGISAIDPLEHDLLMERFLSPIRNTLPDIDLDVESARRLDAYRIIFDRYGKERTACVCMMETYRARSAIRDVAAAMSLSPDEIGAIAKAFPHIRAKHITTALSELPELRRSRLNGAQLETVFGLAQQLDGLPRHVAMHPCGLLLSDKTLLDRTVVQESGEGFPLSQLDKDDAEIAGVIKLDVLGVRMQSAMAHALAEIERTENERIDIDAMPRDDEATYAMIQRSETLGCFQIESPGQRELVKKLAPRDVADLIVDISLFRPGPVNSDMVGPFLRTRHGLAEPCYPHEKLEKALRETGGVVVFHEQVLRIVDVMTGCGLAEADLVRRHLSTEGGPERTAAWFRAQALARGFDPVTVERVWQVVAAFGGFGFCKAHAAAFAIPVYQSAWLRRHHPAAFYAGVLTHDPGMYPKRVIIADARLHGVQILPVDINASAADWKTEPVSGAADHDRGSKQGTAPPAREKRPVRPVLPPAISGRSSDRGSSTADSAAADPRSREGMPSLARRLLETTGPLQVLRLPGRKPPAPVAPQAIRCPFREVKGISEAEIGRIVAGQPYTSLRDFWSRARVSRPVAERLVLIGAIDSLYAAPAPVGPQPDAAAHSPAPPNLRVPPRSPVTLSPLTPRSPVSSPAAAPQPSVSPESPVAGGQRGSRHRVPSSAPRPSRRDLLARVGVLARQSSPARSGALALDLFAGAAAGPADAGPADAGPADAGMGDAEAADGMADLVPAGQLRDLDRTERVQTELEVLGFEVSQHVLDFYTDLLAGLGVVRSTELAGQRDGETILVAGVKVATQTPAVRSGQRIIFASLDDAAGLVDLAFFESVQDRCAARLFGSWLLLARGRVRRAGAGPMAVTVNGYECWDLPALEEIRAAGGIDAVRAAMAAGDVGPGPQLAAGPVRTGVAAPDLDSFTGAPDFADAPGSAGAVTPAGSADPVAPGNRPVPVPAAEADADDPDAPARPIVFGNGFVLSPYAETGSPGGSLKHPPRTLWHASPGSTATPN